MTSTLWWFSNGSNQCVLNGNKWQTSTSCWHGRRQKKRGNGLSNNSRMCVCVWQTLRSPRSTKIQPFPFKTNVKHGATLTNIPLRHAWKMHNWHQQKRQFPHPGCCRWFPCFPLLTLLFLLYYYHLQPAGAGCENTAAVKQMKGDEKENWARLTLRWGHIYNKAVDNNAAFFLPLHIFSTLLCTSTNSDNTVLSPAYRLQHSTTLFQQAFSFEGI